MHLRLSRAGSLLVLALLAPRDAAAQPTAQPGGRAAQTPAAASRPARTVKATTLDVRVEDADGKPLAGALVVAAPVTGAYRPSGGLIAEKTRSALTGPEGEAKLDSLPQGPWTVTVQGRGFVTQSRARVAEGPLVFRLQKGATISGLVRDGQSLHPLAGVRVEVAGPQPAGDWQQEAARNEAITDAQGRFRLEGIGRSPVRLLALAPGFLRAERANVSGGGRVELFLFAGANIAGTVKDEAGRPVKGASVRVEGDRPWEAPPPERTDEAGEFQTAGLAPGEYTVVARHGGTTAPGIATVVVEPAQEASVALVLSEGGYVTGRIMEGGGRPLAGRARVETLDGRGLPEFAAESLTVQTRTDGTFALGPLPLGTLGLELSAAGHAAERVSAEIPARGRTVDLGDVELETGLAVRGRVRDRQGAGIAGARLEAAAERDAAGSIDATSGDDGAFVIGGLGPGRHRVSANAAGYAEASILAEAGGSPLDLVMDAGGQITGRVIDEGGRPVEGARVLARGAVPESRRGSFYSASADEGDGAFVLRDVAPGAYTLQASADGRGEASRSDVTVTAGGTHDVGTLTLARGGVVVGAVVDAEGRGVPGATVSAERDSNQRMGACQTQSDSGGRFEIRGVPIGPVNVFARHPAYAEGRPVVAQVDPENEPVPVRLVLTRGGRIEGRALHRDGRPFSGGRVSFFSLEPGGGHVRFDTTAIDADGSFLVEHVPAGRTMLSLMAFTPSSPMASGGRNTLTGVASREIEVAEGETASCDLVLRDVVVAGRITRGGQPAPGVRVDVMMLEGATVIVWAGPAAAAATAAAAGPPLLAATSREDGGYELLVFSPGAARVQLRGGEQLYAGRSLEIPDVERYELDFELAATTVSGIVVDRATGSPAEEAAVSLRHSAGDKSFGGGAPCGADGRFSLAVEPGEYTLEARAPGHSMASVPLSVSEAGVADVRVELEGGLELAGRLLDAADRPAGGFLILATARDGNAGYSNSQPDGTFRIGGLRSEPHAVAGGSELAGFAFARAVNPGGELFALRLRPPGRIAVRVVDGAGAPVKDAFPMVDAIDGVPVRLPGRVSGPTDLNGEYTLVSPAGMVDVKVGRDRANAKGAVAVMEGQTASLVITLPSSAP